MSRIHADFAYTANATDAGTPALESLRLRRGVCQDFAHVMIGCLRSLGLAARYVSGYLLTEPPPGQPRLVGADASHAWVSVWSPAADESNGASGDNTWFDLDPTNDRAAGEDYVTLAIGRDFSDVSPLRGVIHGGDHHVLQVGVTVEPVPAAMAAAPDAPDTPLTPPQAPESPG
jgi:transglutaminase-like putative cysteine protease